MDYDNWLSTDRDRDRMESLADVCADIEGDLDKLLAGSAIGCDVTIQPCLVDADDDGNLVAEVSIRFKATVRENRTKSNAESVIEQLENLADSMKQDLEKMR